MSINSKIISALSGLVGGHIWSISKPTSADPDVFIVFNPENEYLDYGDDRDQDEEMSYQIHWYAKGHANYLEARRQIRDALRSEGLLLEPSPYVTYDTESGNTSNGVQTGYTHMTIVCRAEDA